MILLAMKYDLINENMNTVFICICLPVSEGPDSWFTKSLN